MTFPGGADHDSDSDAPEEFTHSEARDQALQQRKEERHQRIEQRKQLQKRRRERHEAAAAAKRSQPGESKDGEEPADHARTRGADDEPAARSAWSDGADEDFLPESVLEAVAVKEHQAQQAAVTVAAATAASRKAQRRAAKRQRLQAAKSSLVKVQVLPQLKVQTAGRNYLKETLYGNRLRRSTEMLTKVKNLPATKFV